MRLFFLLLALFATLCKANPIYCYNGTYSFRDAFSGDKTYSDGLEVVHTELVYCSVIFKPDCHIELRAHTDDNEKTINDTHGTCNTDGCNFDVSSFMNNLQHEDKQLFEKCKDSHKRSLKAAVAKPNITLLECAIDNGFTQYQWRESHKKGNNPYCIAVYSKDCRIEYKRPKQGQYFNSVFPKISTLNACSYLDYGDNSAIGCYCISGDNCNTDYQHWRELVIEQEGPWRSDDVSTNCDYSGAKYGGDKMIPLPTTPRPVTKSPTVNRQEYNNATMRQVIFHLFSVVFLVVTA